MRRVLFRWRGITIHAYPALLYVGLVVGLTVGHAAAAHAGLDPTRAYVAMLLLAGPALLGARLWFVALHWGVYRRNPSRILSRSEGGAALYGGLALALALSVPLLHGLGLPFGAFWDASAVVILVGMVFTKVGCLLNGCCAGRPTAGRLGIELPDHRGRRVRRLPAQPLEAGLALFLLASAIAVWPRLPIDGTLFLLATAGYGLGRAGLESTRATIDRWGPLSVNRVISLGLAAAALIILLFRWGAPGGLTSLRSGGAAAIGLRARGEHRAASALTSRHDGTRDSLTSLTAAPPGRSRALTPRPIGYRAGARSRDGRLSDPGRRRPAAGDRAAPQARGRERPGRHVVRHRRLAT